MHGVVGIRFFFETETTTPGGGDGFYVGEREKQAGCNFLWMVAKSEAPVDTIWL